MKNSRVLLVSLLLAVFSFGATAQNTNKVVVISLGGDTGPFAPLTASSPATSDYTIGNPVDNSTATDKVTGLQWQRGDDNVPRNWDDAMAYCQGRDQAGHTDWRLPNIYELSSIVDYGSTVGPTINESVFISTDSERYWSATSKDVDGSKGWDVSFQTGDVNVADKSTTWLARCVRSSRPKGPWLQDNANGTVTDLATGRTWQQLDDDIVKNWSAANSYCSDLVLAGKSDWRLPHIKELASIVDYRVNFPAIDGVMFPSTNLTYYWSASDDASNSARAWLANFTDGLVFSLTKTFSYFVRCVR